MKNIDDMNLKMQLLEDAIEKASKEVDPKIFSLIKLVSNYSIMAFAVGMAEGFKKDNQE